ncbi:MAG: TlpA disulfide reductase family protein [Planctomycetota bacterium]
MRKHLCLIALCSACLAAQRAAGQGEPELWARIAQLAAAHQGPEAPGAAWPGWYEGVISNRVALAHAARLYLTLYPGGPNRDRAARIELTSLFEAGILCDPDLNQVRQRAADLLNTSAAPVADEAGYWLDLLAKLGARPVPGDPRRRGLHAWATLLRERAQSRYVPRIAELCLAEAAERGDEATMAAVIGQVRSHLPGSAAVARLEAEHRRLTAHGQPFWPQAGLDEAVVRGATDSGRPVLVLVWAGFDMASRRCAAELAEFVAVNARFHAIGVALDEDRAETLVAAHELGLDWPQINDEMGWGGEFVRHWAVRELPFLFAIDADGRLVAAGTGREWRRLVSAVEPQDGASRPTPAN